MSDFDLGIGPLPNTDDTANFPKKDKRSAKALAQYLDMQLKAGQTRRRHHALTWAKVKTIMKGNHWYKTLRGGRVVPIKPKNPNKILAQSPLMVPYYRQELGRLNANVLGVSAIPLSGDSASVYAAERGAAILNHWGREVDVEAFYDRANQMELIEGTVGYHWYADQAKQNMLLKPLTGSSLFPVPFNVDDPSEQQGLMHVVLVTEQWLEQQDILFEMQTGQKPRMPMAAMATEMNVSLSAEFPTTTGTGRMRAAWAITTWMNPSNDVPGGQYIFMIKDRIFRYRGGVDERGQSLALPNGRIPVEVVYYTKEPDDWWGKGYCEQLIGPQKSADRSLTAFEENLRLNKALNAYDTDSVDANMVHADQDLLIPFSSQSMGANIRSPFVQIPPTPLGPEAGGLLSVSRDLADQAAGYRSGFVTGQSEGRLEGGPAVQRLADNAEAPLLPTLKRQRNAWRKLYPEILDLLPSVWPESKTVRVSGTDNIGKEMVVTRSDIPQSDQIILSPTPLLPNGTSTLTNVLIQLKNLPGEDGQPGSAVSNRQLFDSLAEMQMLPPKLRQENTASARIQARIQGLIGDGQQPRVQAAQVANLRQDRMQFENHSVAIQLLRNVILHPTFEAYHPQVQQNLMQELDFHMRFSPQGMAHPNSVGQSIEQQDGDAMERFLHAAEQDPSTFEGEIPVNI